MFAIDYFMFDVEISPRQVSVNPHRRFDATAWRTTDIK